MVRAVRPAQCHRGIGIKIDCMKRIFHLFAFLLLLVACASKPELQDDSAGRPESENDLSGKNVSVILGSLQDLALSGRSDIHLVRLSSPSDVLVSVQNGTSDYCLQDSATFIGANLESKGLEVYFGSDLVKGSAAFGLRYDDSALCDELNAFLAMIKSSGLLEEIKSRWCDSDDIASVKMPDIDLPESGIPLRVGAMSTMPMAFLTGNGWAGLEVEILLRFSQYSGRPVEFANYEFSALPAALQSGKIDLISAFMFVTPERQKSILFSDTYFTSRTLCVGRSSALVGKNRAHFHENVKNSFINNLIVDSRWKMLLMGLWETIVISIFAIIFGSVLGALVCWMGMSRVKAVKKTARLYVDLMRGIPILVFLMIMFYVVFASGHIAARWVAIIAFSMNFAGYVSEQFRTAIDGVDKGQKEAGLAMGFTNVSTFFNFIAPQALKNVIPVFKGEAISLIKSTSVVGYIAIQDLTKVSDIIRSRTFDAFFPLIIISIVYFILAWLFGLALDRMASKIK